VNLWIIIILNGNKAAKPIDVKPFTVAELSARIVQSENDFKNLRFKTSEELLA
jgi:hypothetical protein